MAKVKFKVKGTKFATRPNTSGYGNTASSKMKQSEDIVALGPGLQSLVDTIKEDYNRLNLDQPSDDEVISPPAKIYRRIQNQNMSWNSNSLPALAPLLPPVCGWINKISRLQIRNFVCIQCVIGKYVRDKLRNAVMSMQEIQTQIIEKYCLAPKNLCGSFENS